jgi:hypothetical protein
MKVIPLGLAAEAQPTEVVEDVCIFDVTGTAERGEIIT